jgi:hypothetical protein
MQTKHSSLTMDITGIRQEYTCHMSASASAALLGACLVSQALFAAAALHLQCRSHILDIEVLEVPSISCKETSILKCVDLRFGIEVLSSI